MWRECGFQEVLAGSRCSVDQMFTLLFFSPNKFKILPDSWPQGFKGARVNEDSMEGHS